MADVIVKVPAFEMMLKYTAGGIGAVAGPMLAPRRARSNGIRLFASLWPIIFFPARRFDFPGQSGFLKIFSKRG